MSTPSGLRTADDPEHVYLTYREDTDTNERLGVAWGRVKFLIDSMLAKPSVDSDVLTVKQLHTQTRRFTATRRPNESDVLESRPAPGTRGELTSVGRYDNGLGRIVINFWELGGHWHLGTQGDNLSYDLEYYWAAPPELVTKVEKFATRAGELLLPALAIPDSNF